MAFFQLTILMDSVHVDAPRLFGKIPADEGAVAAEIAASGGLSCTDFYVERRSFEKEREKN